MRILKAHISEKHKVLFFVYGLISGLGLPILSACIICENRVLLKPLLVNVMIAFFLFFYFFIFFFFFFFFFFITSLKQIQSN